VWKRMAVKWAQVGRGAVALDVCCGSGDLAFLLADAAGPDGSVSGLDFAQEMLDDAGARSVQDIFATRRRARIKCASFLTARLFTARRLRYMARCCCA